MPQSSLEMLLPSLFANYKLVQVHYNKNTQDARLLLLMEAGTLVVEVG